MGQTEVAEVRALTTRQMADKEWVRKYTDGDREAARQMMLCNIVLCASVARPDRECAMAS